MIEPCKIIVDNPSYSRLVAGKGATKEAREALHYKTVFYKFGYDKKQKRMRNIRHERKASMLKRGRFPTGLIPRLVKHFKKMRIPYEIDQGPYRTLPEAQPPVLPEGYVLRDYQLPCVEAARKSPRGLIEAPTGSGKTVVALSILSMFPNDYLLYIVPTKTLLHQTYKEAKKWFDSVGIYGDGIKQNRRLTIATYQTLSGELGLSGGGEGVADIHWTDGVGVVLVDEAHGISDTEGTIYRILENLPAARRYGLTATIPKDHQRLITMEAAVGPVLGMVPIADLQDQGFLADVTIRLEKITGPYHLSEINRYPHAYEECIVLYEKRNKRIADVAKELIAGGRTVLALVVAVEHGRELAKAFRERGIKFDYLWSGADAKRREIVRGKLDAGKLEAAITTNVWKEGVDIPNLGAVINAAGHKSEIATLQKIGRGLRSTENKKDVIVVDFVDLTHKYLADHALRRIMLYYEKGWLK